MTLSERSLSCLTDTVLPCGFVRPQRHHAEVGESFRKKSTKVNICSEPDTISGCAMAQFGTAPRFLPCSRFFARIKPDKSLAALRRPRSQRSQVPCHSDQISLGFFRNRGFSHSASLVWSLPAHRTPFP